MSQDEIERHKKTVAATMIVCEKTIRTEGTRLLQTLKNEQLPSGRITVISGKITGLGRAADMIQEMREDIQDDTGQRKQIMNSIYGEIVVMESGDVTLDSTLSDAELKTLVYVPPKEEEDAKVECIVCKSIFTVTRCVHCNGYLCEKDAIPSSDNKNSNHFCGTCLLTGREIEQYKETFKGWCKQWCHYTAAGEKNLVRYYEDKIVYHAKSFSLDADKVMAELKEFERHGKLPFTE